MEHKEHPVDSITTCEHGTWQCLKCGQHLSVNDQGAFVSSKPCKQNA